MIFDPATHTLTLERKPCITCSGKGSRSTQVACPKCRGTGNGPRGGRGGCRDCFGSGRSWDHVNRVTCDVCHGDPTGASLENWCDDVPADAVDALSIRVVRQDRDASWNESYLGLGCLWSCSDYGDAWKGSDEAVMDKVIAELRKPYGQPQAVKLLARDYDREATTLPMATGVVILLTRGGYSIRADFQGVEDLARREPNRDQALTIGMAVYNAGGNGTLVAASPVLRRPNGV